MNISIDIDKILIQNIYFLDKKRNIIMDGNFTKILYSNEFFTMNGLYILFPVDVLSIEQNLNKSILKINPYQINNVTIIQEFSKLEARIIDYYKTLYQCKSKTINSLSRQMYSGAMKLYREFNSNYNKSANIQYIVKISGVWETYEEIGLTYKLLEVSGDY
jgi:hypothetical protein